MRINHLQGRPEPWTANVGGLKGVGHVDRNVPARQRWDDGRRVIAAETRMLLQQKRDDWRRDATHGHAPVDDHECRIMFKFDTVRVRPAICELYLCRTRRSNSGTPAATPTSIWAIRPCVWSARSATRRCCRACLTRGCRRSVGRCSPFDYTL